MCVFRRTHTTWGMGGVKPTHPRRLPKIPDIWGCFAVKGRIPDQDTFSLHEPRRWLGDRRWLVRDYYKLACVAAPAVRRYTRATIHELGRECLRKASRSMLGA